MIRKDMEQIIKHLQIFTNIYKTKTKTKTIILLPIMSTFTIQESVGTDDKDIIRFVSINKDKKKITYYMKKEHVIEKTKPLQQKKHSMLQHQIYQMTIVWVRNQIWKWNYQIWNYNPNPMKRFQTIKIVNGGIIYGKTWIQPVRRNQYGHFNKKQKTNKKTNKKKVDSRKLIFLFGFYIFIIHKRIQLQHNKQTTNKYKQYDFIILLYQHYEYYNK